MGMNSYDIWDRFEAIRKGDALCRKPDPVELHGELWLTGPGSCKGVFLRDTGGRPLDINLPSGWQGKRVKIRIELEDG